MSLIKSLFYTTAVSVALALGLLVSASMAAPTLDTHLKQSNPPPPPNNPGSSAAGGRRDRSACPQDADAATANPSMTALSPTTIPGLTVAEHPTFLVYVPETSAKEAEFSLRSRGSNGIYRTIIALTNTPGIIRITLPAQVTPLEVGKQYIWSFAIICNPSDRVEDRFVTSSVERAELDPSQLRQIQQASAKERVVLYQKASAWYDALALLFELKRSQANDPGIRTSWRQFLQSGGIDPLIELSP